MGIESCLKRMREVMCWPDMATKVKQHVMAAEVKQHVQSCDTCIRYQRALANEPLKPHNVPDMPWVKFAVDLCQFEGRTLLVMVD